MSKASKGQNWDSNPGGLGVESRFCRATSFIKSLKGSSEDASSTTVIPMAAFA